MNIATGMTTDKKNLARNYARQYLRFLKRDTLDLLVD